MKSSLLRCILTSGAVAVVTLSPLFLIEANDDKLGKWTAPVFWSWFTVATATNAWATWKLTPKPEGVPTAKESFDVMATRLDEVLAEYEEKRNRRI